MTISVTITKPNVYDQYGILMINGGTYVVDTAFGQSLIQAQKATDTNDALSSPVSGGTNSGIISNLIYLNAAEIAAPSAVVLENVNVVYALNVAPFTRYRSNGSALVTDGGSGGTVTSVSVVTDNGLSGDVATDTTTPAITLHAAALQLESGSDMVKTSALSAAGALDGSELVPIVQDGATVQSTTQDIADLGGSGSGTVTNTGTLTSNNLMIGNGGVDITALGELGTDFTVLHGNDGGAPTYGPVDLATDVTGALLVAINAQTGTTYTVLDTDIGKLVTFNNSSPVAVDLAEATGDFDTGWSTTFQNIGVGTVTITPDTSTIDGAATLVLTTNQGAVVVSDGTDYSTFRGVSITPNQKLGQISFWIGDGVNDISPDDVSLGCVPCFFAGTIVGYTITADAGTCTIKTWKKATGTAIPTISDVISTSGVALATGTVISSSTVSDFTTTAVASNDLFIVQATAVSGAKVITFTLNIAKT